MTRHLCISVTLLDGLFHGKGDGDEPEWPPSPMRLFQALVAGSRTGCRNGDWAEAKAKAFQWLERRDPPVIVGPEASPAAAYTLFVPNNDADKKFDRQERLTSKVVRPLRLLSSASETNGSQALHYLWAIPEDEWAKARPHAELLCHEARHLMALGWGIDQAVADARVLTDAQAAALPGERWSAWSGHFPGRQRRRVPKEGSLKDLEAVHDSFVNRIQSRQRGTTNVLEYNPSLKPRCYDTVVYQRIGTLPPRPYAGFELPEGVTFRHQDAVAAAAMLRSLACKSAKADSHQFPGGSAQYVAGHGPRKENGRFIDENWGRFSYVPLATIGHQHADGIIRRLLVAEPFGGDGSHARWAQQRLRGQVLRDHDDNKRGELLDLWRRSSARMLDLYVGESRNWSSVTPVILPGFDDGKRSKAERLFLQAVQQAGLPLEAVAEFTLRKAPFWPGSLHPKFYRRPDYLDNAKSRRFSAWHVALAFRDAVCGPVMIGAGRHCGLGVFARVP